MVLFCGDAKPLTEALMIKTHLQPSKSEALSMQSMLVTGHGFDHL